MAVITKEVVHAGFRRSHLDVPLAEYGGECVRMLAPSAARVLQLRKDSTAIKEAGGDPESLTPAIVAECLVDEANEQLFVNGEGESFVLSLSTPSYIKLQTAAAKLMGISDADVEDAIKN